MSDTGSWGAASPGGPDWYQASDGLWYPPAGQQPVVAPPVAPQPAYTQVVPAEVPAYGATEYVAPAAGTGWQPGMVVVSYNGTTEEVPRFKWIYAVLTCIPQVIGLIVAQIIAVFSMYAAFFGVLLYQRVHPRSHDNIVKSYRYQWRLGTYLMQWRNDVPPAPTTGAIDDGADRAQLSVAYGGEGLARFGPIIKIFKAIPEIIGVIVALIVAYIAWIIGVIGILTKGVFPQAQAERIVTAYRKATALNAYLLLTDVKPQV